MLGSVNTDSTFTRGLYYSCRKCWCAFWYCGTKSTNELVILLRSTRTCQIDTSRTLSLVLVVLRGEVISTGLISQVHPLEDQGDQAVCRNTHFCEGQAIIQNGDHISPLGWLRLWRKRCNAHKVRRNEGEKPFCFVHWKLGLSMPGCYQSDAMDCCFSWICCNHSQPSDWMGLTKLLNSLQNLNFHLIL